MNKPNPDVPMVQHARVAEVLRDLAGKTPRQQLDALLERGDFAQLLPRLPIQDVYGLLRQVGVADALEILEYANPEVLLGITDFAVWTQDRVDPRSLAQFYAALFHADQEGAVERAAVRVDSEISPSVSISEIRRL